MKSSPNNAADHAAPGEDGGGANRSDHRYESRVRLYLEGGGEQDGRGRSKKDRHRKTNITRRDETRRDFARLLARRVYREGLRDT